MAEPVLADNLRQAVTGLLARLPAYGRLYWRLVRHERLTGPQRALALAALAYMVSPIDLVPGFIPVVGQMDDVAVALLGLRALLRRLPPAAAARHLTAVGLSAAQLDADLATLGQMTLVLGRTALTFTSRLLWLAGRGTRTAAMALTRRADRRDRQPRK